MAEEAEGPQREPGVGATENGQGPPSPAAEGAEPGAAAVAAEEEAAPLADHQPEVPSEPPAQELLEQARREAAVHFDKYLRLQAEFENYKRRMQKEQGDVLKYAHLPLLRDLAGVVDNLERAIGHARNSGHAERQPFVEGLELVTKQIGDVFERYGMTRIAAKGQPFDPHRHEAMKVVETDEFPENTVIEEFQTGYALHERIVRPSMVTVSKRPQAAAGETPADGGAAR